MLTFEQFQAAGKRLTDMQEAVDQIGLEDVEGFAAALFYDGCWIMEYTPGRRPWKYWLIICNQEWESDDLAELERLLYDNWYISEG